MVRGPVFEKHCPRSSSCSDLTFLPYLHECASIWTHKLTHSRIQFIILCFFAINLQEGHNRMQDGEKDTIDFFPLKTFLFLQIRFYFWSTEHKSLQKHLCQFVTLQPIRPLPKWNCVPKQFVWETVLNLHIFTCFEPPKN